MKLTRRGLFGTLLAAVAAKILPTPKVERPTRWDFQPTHQLEYISPLAPAGTWTVSESDLQLQYRRVGETQWITWPNETIRVTVTGNTIDETIPLVWTEL